MVGAVNVWVDPAIALISLSLRISTPPARPGTGSAGAPISRSAGTGTPRAPGQTGVRYLFSPVGASRCIGRQTVPVRTGLFGAQTADFS